jgi:hypothetical protein
VGQQPRQRENILRQEVLRVETSSAATCALCFHPFRPLLTTVDTSGMVAVHNYRYPPAPENRNVVDVHAIVNRFNVASGDFLEPRPCTHDGCLPTLALGSLPHTHAHPFFALVWQRPQGAALLGVLSMPKRRPVRFDALMAC